MIKRDVIDKKISIDCSKKNTIFHNKKNLQDMYQIHGTDQNNTVKIVYIAKYDYIPCAIIFKQTLDDIECIIVSYMVSSFELTTTKSYKIVGYVIPKKGSTDSILGQLNLVFVPNVSILINDTNDIVSEGHFEIHLEHDIDGDIEILKKIDKYMGKSESLIILAEAIIEYNVIDKLKEFN